MQRTRKVNSPCENLMNYVPTPSRYTGCVQQFAPVIAKNTFAMHGGFETSGTICVRNATARGVGPIVRVRDFSWKRWQRSRDCRDNVYVRSD
jgi:hypothetical protein